MRMNRWIKDIVRSPQDEGAGGSSEPFTGEGDPSAPADDRYARLEARLAKMTQTQERDIEARKVRETTEKIRVHETKLANDIASAETGVATAQANLAASYEDGDSTQIAAATAAVTEAVAQRERAKMERDSWETRKAEVQRRQEQDGRSGGGEVDTTNLESWKSRNSAWYGVDAEMTREAHALDRQITEAGVISVGTTQYFEAIDKAMAQKFPDKWGGTPPVGGAGGSAGGGGGRPQRGGRVAQSVAEGWRRMGINVDDPKTLDRMLGHRQELASKGILTPEPITAPVRTR